MTSIRNQSALVTTTLVAAVADDATFTFAYPAGTSQLSFNSGLAAPGGYMIVNGNDRWSQADPGFSLAFGASLITVTNLTGATLPAGSEIRIQLELQDGKARIPLSVQIDLAAIAANGDVVTDIRPGIAGTIESAEFVVNVPVTTGAKLATLNIEIDTTDVTGGVIALTSANATPRGKSIVASDITGANVLTRESKLSVEASGVTAFSEGSGTLIIYIRPAGQDQY